MAASKSTSVVLATLVLASIAAAGYFFFVQWEIAGQFPVARITGAEFEKHIGIPPVVVAQEKRDYGVFLLLNTLAPEFGCPACKGVNGDLVGEFVSQNGRIAVTPPQSSKKGIFIFTAGAVLILIATIKIYVGRNIFNLIYEPKLWAIASMTFVIMMTSGFMWVRIRGAPYVVNGQNGLQYYFAGLQNQLGMETQIIGFLNGIAAISMVALSTKIPEIHNATARRIAVIVCMAVIVTAFSAEIALFRRKMAGYPFKILFS